MTIPTPRDRLKEFLHLESSGGILLMFATVLALLISNSPASPLYSAVLDTRFAVILGELVLDKPLLLWINDGLMAVFFFLIGLELKREIMVGQLSSREQIVLPLIGAIGGFVVPALIYIGFNANNPEALNGWAIPSATDIAFALGVLALLGSRVPFALKIFLTTLAIIDDLAAILVIALFYSGDLSMEAIGLAALGLFILVFMNTVGVYRKAPYILMGILIWICVLKSGVHATLAGVLVAFTIPMLGGAKTNGERSSPLREIEHDLHPWVAFGVLPIFAFANAGVDMRDIEYSALVNSVSIGIFAGLLLGKTLGVFGLVRLAVNTGWVNLPSGVSWTQMLGVSVLTGIGFTMSLFISTLAFEHGPFDYLQATRVGVLAASIVAATLGSAILYLSSRKTALAVTAS